MEVPQVHIETHGYNCHCYWYLPVYYTQPPLWLAATHVEPEPKCCLRFLNKMNPQFKELHGTLDNLFRGLHENGSGHQDKTCRNHHKGGGEQTLGTWAAGDLYTWKALLNAVFYYNGKSFCLRGGVEHRHLKLSQLQRTHNPDGYIYNEYVSKNQAGTYKQLHLQSKVVLIYTCPDAGTRCHVYLLDLYFSKLPQDAIQNDIFYVRPLQEAPTDPTLPWCSAVPIGKHTLNNMVKIMCQKAGIEGRKTNHSLLCNSSHNTVSSRCT